MLALYGFGRVNKIARGNTRDLRVLWALEEMALPFEIKGIDHPAHELDTPEFRAMNPFGQLPVIDDDGVVISESGAILIYLARKSGKLIPPDLGGEGQVLRWSFASLTTLEWPLMSILFMDFMGKEKHAAWREWMVQLAHRQLSRLESWLDGRTWIATDELTVADILLAHVLFVNRDDSLLAPYPRVLAYRDRCKARPAWQRIYEAYCERVEAA